MELSKDELQVLSAYLDCNPCRAGCVIEEMNPGEGKDCDECQFEKISWELRQKVWDEIGKTQFPCIEGELAEMFVDSEWVKGRIVNGYRFCDGVVTIETDDGKRYWCGQDRTELYRPFKEINADGAEKNN